MASNTVIGELFQEGTSHVRPPYFNGQHFSHWKVRMETYTIAYDIKVWQYYTEEQAVVIQVNTKAKILLYNALSEEEYEKISSCEIAKDMWDKLEVTYEETNKVKETMINLLVRDYELFQMKNGESVEEMFSRFSKILGDLKSFGRPIRSGE
nr:uncharacterized protein LOC117278220 [Nicotiana tomentosiformis]